MEQEERKDHSGLKIVVTPWRDMPDEKYKLTLIFVFAAVGLVILIAAPMWAVLLLSRAVQRQRRLQFARRWGRAMAVYAAVLSESLVLAVLGSLAGSWWHDCCWSF